MKRGIAVKASIAILMLLGLFAATAAAADGSLRTRVDPRVAGVFIDGKYYGTAAMFSHRQAAIKLPEGNYTVRLVDPRYKDLVVPVGIQADKMSTIRRQMEPLGVKPKHPLGELTAEGFGNAAIYLNDRYYANAAELDNPIYSLLLEPGDYDMKIVPVSGETARQEKITINADETLVIAKNKASARRR